MNPDGEKNDDAANTGTGDDKSLEPIVQAIVLITNQRGLHARAAARFVKMAERFNAKVTVSRKDMSVSGSSIMGLMMLAAGPGTDLVIKASGAEAQAAVDALAGLVAAKFDED